MSKDQVWKIIFFFHSNRTKKFFEAFPDWKMTIFSHTFQDCIGTLSNIVFEENGNTLKMLRSYLHKGWRCLLHQRNIYPDKIIVPDSWLRKDFFQYIVKCWKFRITGLIHQSKIFLLKCLREWVQYESVCVAAHYRMVSLGSCYI